MENSGCCHGCYRMVVFRACPDAVLSDVQHVCHRFELPHVGVRRVIADCERAYRRTAFGLVLLSLPFGLAIADYLLR